MRNSIVTCAMIGLWACGVGEDGTAPPPSAPSPPSSETPSTSSPPAATEDAGPSGSDSAPPPTAPASDAASACPILTGSWSGKLDGTITGQADGKVTGTATFLFAAGGAQEEYGLQSGSKLTLNVDVDGTTVPIAQALAGSAKCGALAAAQDSQVFGHDVHTTAKCTFTASGCSGTWTAIATDDSTAASGTFTVLKN